MPFGEYVPLPQGYRAASSVRGIVGDFTPGSSYTLMPSALFASGFICIEARILRSPATTQMKERMS